MYQMNLFKRYTPLQIFMHTAAWFPFARLAFEAFTHDLTANPIQHLEQRTGRAAITLLTLCLACTPLNTIFGWSELLKRRRALGLYTFLYATIHISIFFNLDNGIAWSFLIQTIIQKSWILYGFAAFLLMIPLGMTSFDVWKARLGKNWWRLHNVIYFIAPLALLHYALGKKGAIFALQGDIIRPLIYALVFVLLMILRIPLVRRTLVSWRTRLRVRFSRRVVKETNQVP